MTTTPIKNTTVQQQSTAKSGASQGILQDIAKMGSGVTAAQQALWAQRAQLAASRPTMPFMGLPKQSKASRQPGRITVTVGSDKPHLEDDAMTPDKGAVLTKKQFKGRIKTLGGKSTYHEKADATTVQGEGFTEFWRHKVTDKGKFVRSLSAVEYDNKKPISSEELFEKHDKNGYDGDPRGDDPYVTTQQDGVMHKWQRVEPSADGGDDQWQLTSTERLD